MSARSLKDWLKGLAFRLFRPGLRDVYAKLDAISERVESLGRSTQSAAGSPVGAHWRGGLDGYAVDVMGKPCPSMTAKYRDELTYWEATVKRDAPRMWGGPFEQVFGGWQRDRFVEFARYMEMTGAELDLWCSTRSAVEIGAGPYPSIAVKKWRRAVAIDPLADGYIAEGLLPTNCHAEDITYLASAGEAVPLPSGFADLVVIENCLDHVDDPPAVVREIFRLLRPGGLLWVLVDLMDYRDHMHPNPLNEGAVRRLMSECGFQVIKDHVSDHKSHPEAYGEYRGLLRRPEPAGAPEVRVVTGRSAPVLA